MIGKKVDNDPLGPHALFLNFENYDKSKHSVEHYFDIKNHMDQNIDLVSKIIGLPIVTCQQKIESMDFSLEERIKIMNALLSKEE